MLEVREMRGSKKGVQRANGPLPAGGRGSATLRNEILLTQYEIRLRRMKYRLRGMKYCLRQCV
jgi:hypothetical protein